MSSSPPRILAGHGSGRAQRFAVQSASTHRSPGLGPQKAQRFSLHSSSTYCQFGSSAAWSLDAEFEETRRVLVGVAVNRVVGRIVGRRLWTRLGNRGRCGVGLRRRFEWVNDPRGPQGVSSGSFPSELTRLRPPTTTTSTWHQWNTRDEGRVLDAIVATREHDDDDDDLHDRRMGRDGEDKRPRASDSHAAIAQPHRHEKMTQRTMWLPLNADEYWGKVRDTLAKEDHHSLRTIAAAVTTGATDSDRRRTHEEVALQAAPDDKGSLSTARGPPTP